MIKNKIKLGLVALGTIATVGLSTSAALAAVLEYSANTGITLTGSGVSLVIQSGSKATSLVIGTGSLDVVVPTSSTFTVTSANIFNTSGVAGGTVAQSCTSNTNTLTITTTGTTGTYTLTPTGSQCAAVSGGGGGGGGGGDTTPPTGTSVSINAGVAETNTTSVTLTLGATDAYQMLVSNTSDLTGASWEAYATSKAWVLTAGEGTKTVYVKFRDLAGNISSAVSDTITFSLTAVVTTPPATTTTTQGTTTTTTTTTTAPAALKPLPYPAATTTAEMQANLAVLLENLAVLQGLISTPPQTLSVAFNVNIAPGARGTSVTALQNFLKSQGTDIYPEGLVTGFYGNLTKAAVGRFQLKYGVVASSSDAGYGFVGPKTRAKINMLLGF